MNIASFARSALVAVLGLASQASASHADSGTVTLTIYKAGWIIGGSGGSGTLNFHGKTYGLSSGGLDYGLVFGGSKTVLHGKVSNINKPSDVAGVYGAAGAGLQLSGGADRMIALCRIQGTSNEDCCLRCGCVSNRARMRRAGNRRF